MLKINNLTKHYKGSDKGVNNVTLHIDKGDIYAFIGHNGAGKTTLLRCLNFLETPRNGQIPRKRLST